MEEFKSASKRKTGWKRSSFLSVNHSHNSLHNQETLLDIVRHSSADSISIVTFRCIEPIVSMNGSFPSKKTTRNGRFFV